MFLALIQLNALLNHHTGAAVLKQPWSSLNVCCFCLGLTHGCKARWIKVVQVPVIYLYMFSVNLTRLNPESLGV